VSAFHRVLAIRLGQLMGEEPSVWRDARLRGNDDFASRLDGEVPSSAVIVSVVSPRYLKSDWCRREISNFAAGTDVQVGHRSRVFKVLKTPIDCGDEPEIMRSMLGYEFFRRDEASGRCREFTGVEDGEYLTRLDDLAHDISETLKVVDAANGSGAGDAADGPGDPSGLAVYLAMTSSDVAEQRDQVRRELVDRGYRVFPDRTLPLIGAECREAVREMLAQAVVSIHLVGRYYGSIPEGDDQSMVHLQLELASERAAADDFTQLVWLPADLEPAEERQARFVDSLRSGEGERRGTELLSVVLEAFKTYTLETLDVVKARRTARAGAPGPGSDAEDVPPTVYVVYSPSDLDTAERVLEVLYERGLDVLQSVFEGDEAELRELHKSNLQECDSVLIVYDTAPAVWLETRLRELRKCMGYGRERPLTAKGVYVTGEMSSHKRMFRSRDATVVKDFDLAPAQALEPFVSAALATE